jgi:hypothetical protein
MHVKSASQSWFMRKPVDEVSRPGPLDNSRRPDASVPAHVASDPQLLHEPFDRATGGVAPVTMKV